MSSQKSGTNDWEFTIKLKDGEPASFKIMGEFMPPSVVFSKGEVFFGVLKPH